MRARWLRCVNCCFVVWVVTKTIVCFVSSQTSLICMMMVNAMMCAGKVVHCVRVDSMLCDLLSAICCKCYVCLVVVVNEMKWLVHDFVRAILSLLFRENDLVTWNWSVSCWLIVCICLCREFQNLCCSSKISPVHQLWLCAHFGSVDSIVLHVVTQHCGCTPQSWWQCCGLSFHDYQSHVMLVGCCVQWVAEFWDHVHGVCFVCVY